VRPLALYLRSRRVPAAVAAAVAAVAVLWPLAEAADDPTARAMLGLLAVVAGTVAAGPGLAGADADLDRTAAVAWPPRRAAHLVAACAAAARIVAATALTGHQLAAAGRVARDAVGMSGLVALGATTLGAGRAWLVPLTWTLVAMTLVAALPPSSAATPQEVLTWMLQPADATPATATAAVLGAAGLLAYAALGARP
jgi:hypothetical protein